MYKSKKKCLEDVAFRINMVLKPFLLYIFNLFDSEFEEAFLIICCSEKHKNKVIVFLISKIMLFIL